MRILITGDRHWVCVPLAERILTRLIARYGLDLVIIHGGAPGVDNSFAETCRKFDIKAEAHVADWKGLGNIAGPSRNRRWLNRARRCTSRSIARLRPATGRRIASGRHSRLASRRIWSKMRGGFRDDCRQVMRGSGEGK
jgi:YspA, cpYpsA-related SLOG family